MFQQAEIDAQLQRILASPAFAASPRSTQFLAYCVRNGLDGNAIHLKETTIAVEVFNRAPGYDPKSDPIVRVHARRVREKLALYYRTAGSADPIRIELPKGRYIPSVCRTLPTRKTDFSDWPTEPARDAPVGRHGTERLQAQMTATRTSGNSGVTDPTDSGSVAARETGVSGIRGLARVVAITPLSLLAAVLKSSLAWIDDCLWRLKGAD